MLCSFPKFSIMMKISARIKNWPVLSWSFLNLDLVWDTKNIYQKYVEVSRPMTNMFYDSASSRFDQLVRN